MKHKMVIKTKKDRLPKGFLTVKGNPTENALVAYLVYLKNLPKDWDVLKINMDSIKKVREYFKVDYGFDVMIYWGIQVACAKSMTSSGRYVAMSKSYHDALGKIGQGYVLSTVKLDTSS